MFSYHVFKISWVLSFTFDSHGELIFLVYTDPFNDLELLSGVMKNPIDYLDPNLKQQGVVYSVVLIEYYSNCFFCPHTCKVHYSLPFIPPSCFSNILGFGCMWMMAGL